VRRAALELAMKLYYIPGSSSLSSHIALVESGLPFEIKRIKTVGNTKVIEGGDGYHTINPLGYVPSLDLGDGTIVTEGPAILQLVADRAPEKNLAPPNGTVERTKLQSWLNFLSSEVHKGGLSPLFYAGMPQEAKTIFFNRLAVRFAYIDEHLGRNEYLIGSAFSVADAHLFTLSNWANWIDVDLSPHVNILAYRRRVGARAAVQAALRAEGLIPWPSHPV
jgi:glutathione S-transferase